MALTVANVEAELVNRLSGRLAYVGYSVVTDGTNPNLKGPIRKGFVFATGREPASIAAVVDADLARVVDSPTYDKLLDSARLEALRSVLGQTSDVDTKAGDGEQKLSQFMAAVLAEIADLEASLRSPYGSALPAGSVGSVTTGTPMPNDPFNPCGDNPPACYPQQWGIFP